MLSNLALTYLNIDNHWLCLNHTLVVVSDGIKKFILVFNCEFCFWIGSINICKNLLCKYILSFNYCGSYWWFITGFPKSVTRKFLTRRKDGFSYHSTTQSVRHYKFSLNVPNEYIDEGCLEVIIPINTIEGNTSVKVPVITKDPNAACYYYSFQAY